MKGRYFTEAVLLHAKFLRGAALFVLALLLAFGNFKTADLSIPPALETGAVSMELPHVAMTALPSLGDDRILHISYEASDNAGIAQIALRVTPHSSLPGAAQMPVDIALDTDMSQHIARSDAEDLAAYGWADQNVFVQIIATNANGATSESDPVSVSLPEHRFFQPIARVLIEERKKLLQNPDDEKTRDEAANIMAGLAQQTVNFHGDPVVLMALRSGAVRLVLNNDRNTVILVNGLLWQTAMRIEEGSPNETQRSLRDTFRDLSSLQDF